MTTFHQLLTTGSEKYGSRTAILFDEQRISYERLLTRVEGIARGFKSFGITEEDHVAIIMDNSLNCVFAWLASSVIGCTEVPINPEYRNNLLAYLMRDSDSTVVVCDAEYLEQVLEISAELPMLRLIVVNGEACNSTQTSINLESFEAANHYDPGLPMVTAAPERVILYTSGTTGPSKGVTHTQRSSLVLAQYNAHTLQYDESDRLLNFFPLFHQNARYTGVIPALCVGASIRLEKKLHTSTFWDTCDTNGITAFNYLGSVLRLILNVTPPERTTGNHTIKKAFGAGAPPDVWQEFEDRLGIRLVETYGLSEAPMATLNVRMGDNPSRIGSAGRASDLFEVAIVDERDYKLNAGEIGEIVLRPKRPDAMMTGYFNNDSATVKAFRNLWFHSGDRGRLSEAGELFFEERQKESIRRRGENISAWEVESVIDRHPDVAESAVYAIPCDTTEEDVAVALVLRREDADLGAILEYAERHLPKYAVPTLFRVMKDFPRTPTQKVQKEQLRKAKSDQYITAEQLKVLSDKAPELK